MLLSYLPASWGGGVYNANIFLRSLPSKNLDYCQNPVTFLCLKIECALFSLLFLPLLRALHSQTLFILLCLAVFLLNCSAMRVPSYIREESVSLESGKNEIARNFTCTYGNSHKVEICRQSLCLGQSFHLVFPLPFPQNWGIFLAHFSRCMYTVHSRLPLPIVLFPFQDVFCQIFHPYVTGIFFIYKNSFRWCLRIHISKTYKVFLQRVLPLISGIYSRFAIVPFSLLNNIHLQY